jgi:hypothetical protein
MGPRGHWTIVSDSAALVRFVAEAQEDAWARHGLIWRTEDGLIVAGALAALFQQYPFLDVRRQLKRLNLEASTVARLLAAVAAGAVVGYRVEEGRRPIKKALA